MNAKNLALFNKSIKDIIKPICSYKEALYHATNALKFYEIKKSSLTSYIAGGYSLDIEKGTSAFSDSRYKFSFFINNSYMETVRHMGNEDAFFKQEENLIFIVETARKIALLSHFLVSDLPSAMICGMPVITVSRKINLNNLNNFDYLIGWPDINTVWDLFPAMYRAKSLAYLMFKTPTTSPEPNTWIFRGNFYIPFPIKDKDE